MSNIPDLTIGELIPLLRDTYNAIDLRAILLENKKGWECIFFVLRMTIQDKEKLESLYKKSRSLISGERPDVQFVYESRDVSKFESILEQINNGTILIGTYRARIKNASIVKGITRTLSGYVISDDSGFPHKVLVVPYGVSDINPRKRLENHGIQPSDLGLTWFEDIDSFFDAGKLYDPYHLILVFPIYAKILECYANEVERALYSKFEIHERIFSNSEIRLQLRSSDHKLIENRKIEQSDVLPVKNRNGIVTFSNSQDISSLKPGSSGTLRIGHEKLGEVASSSFELRPIAHDFENINISQLAPENLPLMTTHQLTNFLRSAGVDYDSSTNVFKIKDDGQTFRLTQDNLITTNFGDLFYNKLKDEINLGYKFGLYSSVTVLSRKLVENLLIDILKKRFPPNEEGNLELYYDTKRNRFHDFALLLDNLERMKNKFRPDEHAISKFILLAEPFRMSANSNAHSIIEVTDKEKIIEYKIPDMIGLLMRLSQTPIH